MAVEEHFVNNWRFLQGGVFSRGFFEIDKNIKRVLGLYAAKSVYQEGEPRS